MREPKTVAAIVNALRQVHGDDIARSVERRLSLAALIDALLSLAAEKQRRDQTDHPSALRRRFHRQTGFWSCLASEIFL